MTRPDEDATESHDSGGMPSGGRTLSGGGFADDHGQADPVLREVLSNLGDSADAAAERRLLGLVAAARWLVPAVAVPVDPDRPAPEHRHHGHSHDGHGPPATAGRPATEMSAVTLTGPDGRRAMLVFSGLDALAEWDPAARPVPVSAQTAAQAAVSEGCDVLVVDVASDHATELRPSMVWALAQDQAWVPAHEDPFVERAVSRACQDESAVVRHTLGSGPAGTLVVTLALPPGLDATAVQALATRVGEQLATDGELRARVDGLAFRVLPA